MDFWDVSHNFTTKNAKVDIMAHIVWCTWADILIELNAKAGLLINGFVLL